MQGDVTRIMEMSDFERRKIIDEIAGVSEFDTKKQQSLAELDIVRERIEREELLLIELSRRANELKREREHALEYQKWQKESPISRTAAPRPSSIDREKELRTLTQSAEEHRIHSPASHPTAASRRTSLSYVKADLKDIDELINKKSGSDYLKLIAELEEAKSGIKLAEQTIVRLRREKETNLEAINRVYMDTKRAEARVAECTDQIRTLTIDRTNIAMEVATSRAQARKDRDRAQAAQRGHRGSPREAFLPPQRGRGEEGAALGHPPPAGHADREEPDAHDRARTPHRPAPASWTRNTRQNSRSSRDSETSVAGLLDEKKELTGTSRNWRVPSLPSARPSSASARRSARTNRTRSGSRPPSRPGASPGAGRSRRSRPMDGVHGTIAELGKAPAEYSTALNIAAGNKLQFVVCDDDQIAADAIRYLKEERLGRVTFLPLNKFRPPALPPVKEPGIVDYAVNLLEVRPEVRPGVRGCPRCNGYCRHAGAGTEADRAGTGW